jgi:hypothetical protein
MSRNKRRGQKKSKQLKNRNRILLIVENSEEPFFNRYFKQFLAKDSIDIKCERSGKAGNCDITNGSRMSKIINDALDIEEYRAVFLMMDLKTKCHQSEQTHTCLFKLIQEYRPKYKVKQKNKFYLFVVCNEIESWFLTIDKKINNTNNVNENHKAKLKKILEVRSEPEIVDKIIEGLNSGKYQLDFSKNKSLQHFIKKLQEFNANP